VFSLERDLHAHAVIHELAQRDATSAFFVATDALSRSGGIRWSLGGSRRAELRSYTGEWFEIAGVDVVWWRRVNQPQLIDDPNVRELTRNFIDNEWRTALAGLMLSDFAGAWVNDPVQEVRAGNKMLQLRVAAELGFRVPRTLVSQDPAAVRRFIDDSHGHVVVKKLLGTAGRPLATVEIGPDDELGDEAIGWCPAIYQEVIEGTRHVRANCFGAAVYSVLIQSPLLDWRRDLSVPFVPLDLPDDVNRRLVAVNEALGLRMGVVDLMYDAGGDLVWLELNPQGQFLFGEALSGRELMRPFADFLIAEADAPSVRNR
jgi:hypothetical protein